MGGLNLTPNRRIDREAAKDRPLPHPRHWGSPAVMLISLDQWGSAVRAYSFGLRGLSGATNV